MSSFQKGFGVTMGVLAALLVIPMMCAGLWFLGCLGVVGIGMNAKRQDRVQAQLEPGKKAAAQEWDRRVAEEQRKAAAQEDVVQRRRDAPQELSPAEEELLEGADDREGWARAEEERKLDALADVAAAQMAPKIVAQYLAEAGRVAFNDGAGRATRLSDLGTKQRPLRRWVGSGTVETINSSGDLVQLPWELHLAHRDGKFVPAALFLNGSLLFEDRNYAEIARAAEAEGALERRAETKQKRLAKSDAAKQTAEAKADEEKAAALLKAAKPLLPVNKKAAQRRLQEIVEKYPDTEAAAEARKLLK